MSASIRAVRLAMPVPLHRTFDYTVPAGLRVPSPGARVRAPFAGRTLVGVCVDDAPAEVHPNPKPLVAVLDDANCLGAELFELAHWLADYYHHPLGEVFETILPAAAARGEPLVATRESAWRAVTGDPEFKVTMARAPRQRALFDHLALHGALTASEIRAAGFTTAMLEALATKGAVEPGAPDFVAERPPRLTPDQAAALAALEGGPRGFDPVLIEGVTGSGKTELYLRAIEAVLARGQQALVLVPEIALTPQTLARFRRRFGETHVLHSGLGDRERLSTWVKCRDGGARIVVGTRSAALTPFAALGVIVVDEEHDGSFKQTEGLRYNARDVAVVRARTLGIPLLLGSATPALESLHNARRARYRHVQLATRATGAPMPRLRILDIRGHASQDGISAPLTHVIRRHLDAGGQALVFLNRRGYAPALLCPGCGWRATCPACDAHFTAHRTPPGLVCHHCGRRAPLPPACPDCARPDPRPVGVGTQRTEQGLISLYPDVPVYRIDRDSTRSSRRLEEQLARIHGGEPAILVGTQLLAKGHDFANVTLVATVNADAGFLSADFRAPERTAQIVIQVAGRAGRAGKPGEVWIQTLQPDHPALISLVADGYAGFAATELDAREAAGLPPFRPMALVRAESTSAEAAHTFLHSLRPRLAGIEAYGPAPAPLARVADRHRCQLLLLAATRPALHEALARLRDATAPRALRWAIDVDPYDTF